MKIRMSLEVPDPARAYIARLSGCDETTRNVATRESVVAFLQAQLAAMSEAFCWSPTSGQLSDDEIGDAQEAVDWLQRNGKTDAQIRSWLLLQKARADITRERIAGGMRQANEPTSNTSGEPHAD